MERRSLKNVWFWANVVGLLGIFGPILLLLGISKLLTLYDLFNPFDTSEGLGIFLFFSVVGIVTIWIFISKSWKRWALEEIHPEDREDLLYKLESKDSVVLKGWSELNPLYKGLRVFGLMSLAAVCIFIEWKRGEDNRLYAEDGVDAWAEIIQYKKKYKKKKLNIVLEYSYMVDSVLYEDEKTISSGWIVSAEQKLGFTPLKGDKIKMQYLSRDATKNRLKYDQLGDATVERLVRLSAEKMRNEAENKAMAECIAEAVNQEFGMRGTYLILNKEVSHWKNVRYNAFKYERLIKDERFLDITKSCTPKKVEKKKAQGSTQEKGIDTSALQE